MKIHWRTHDKVPHKPPSQQHVPDSGRKKLGYKLALEIFSKEVGQSKAAIEETGTLMAFSRLRELERQESKRLDQTYTQVRTTEPSHE